MYLSMMRPLGEANHIIDIATCQLGRRSEVEIMVLKGTRK